MTQTSQEKYRLILVPHTHWDREWYLPYQRYRTRLVGFFDLLLEIFERDPEYKHFLLDGHTILIEDYLEVRPDRRADIERVVQDGRLAVGPWYEIPDMSLPSGEALVRNLLRGHRVAEQFGPVMKVGYIPDPFGQIAHMPAILRGFGIDRCVFWRGVDESLKTTEFMWESPDGSDVLVVHMPGGYGIGGPFPLENDDQFEERIGFIRERLEPLAQTRTLLAMWGSDHVAPQPELPGLVREVNARLPDAEVVQGGLTQVFDEVEAQVSREDLERRSGEFRSGQRAHLLPGVLSARMWIKQATFANEQLLTRWAEPLTLWSGSLRQQLGEAWNEPPRVAGPPSPHPKEAKSEAGLIDRAWRLLLENQPHDSICGCSIDQTHDEMRPRFDQCEQVGEDLTQHAIRRISAQGPADRVFVFNPLPGPRTDYATVVVPKENGSLPVALVDEDGRRYECQLVEGEDADDRTMVGFVPEVPGFGYRAFEVEHGESSRTASATTRIENDSSVVEADPRDGTLSVEIPGTGVRWTGLNRLVDGGDRGDEYNYCATDPEVFVDGPESPPQISVIENGPARQTLEIKMTYRLPARLTSRRKRFSRTVACPVRVVVSISPGVPRIDIRTEIDNRAEDHRLRAYFPTNMKVDRASAEMHFGVVERPLALPEHNDTWSEQPVGTHPQKTFCDVSDGHGGMMIANRGLPEYEVLDTVDGATIALTLFRSVGWLSRFDFPSRKGGAGPNLETPGAQLLGVNVAEYSIIPHREGWENAYEQAHRFAAPMRARWNRQGSGVLPGAGSLVELEGDGLVVSALKRPEGVDQDGETILRLYNILDVATEGRVRLTEPSSRVDVVDMKEELLGPATVEDGWAQLALKPNEIVTLRFEASS